MNPDQAGVGRQGDSYVLIAEFPVAGESRNATSTSIHQFGASSRRWSPHYADQASLFVKRTMKPTWRLPAELAKHAERAYHPGQ